ncbi:MAG TPA: YqaE/Pmp3 family membrane protein [Rubrobacteraceae bacterium]|nr:YqaE/Pmp3 family membrane protein [Rubrobacteraceae bacterium]
MWQVGLTRHFWLNVIQTILDYLPRLIHALCDILARRG